jgi:uncharacterized protein YjbI with pentapeptide repeats
VAPLPTDPAPARPPRRPGRPSAFDPAAVDELYPDVDGVDLEDASLALPEARTLDLLRSRLVDCELDVPATCAIELRDCEVEGVDLTGRRIGHLARVVLRRCRLGGADLGGAVVEDVVLDDCALDLASWRMASLERVEIRGGRLDGLDATGARLSDVRVDGTSLSDVTLDGVRCERVDLTGAELGAVRALSHLAGATISVMQAVALSARLAHGLGIAVQGGDDTFPAGDDRK